MNDTPKTDAMCHYMADKKWIDFARDLERENNALRAAIVAARGWFDFNHLDAVSHGKTKLSGDAVRDLHYAFTELGAALLANAEIGNAPKSAESSTKGNQ